MFRVIFVCLGNICRSPMGEAIFKRMVEEEGFASSFSVASFGTSDCEEGNPVYPPAARTLKAHGYSFTHRAKAISLADIKNADYVLCMDKLNYRDIFALTGGGYADKIFLLGGFLPEKIIIDDPWYTRDFERTFGEIYRSCACFLEYLKRERGSALLYDKFD